MDQLKEILGVVKRQHFWFIAPILVVVGVLGWMMANRQLSEDFDKNKRDIQGYVSQMNTVSTQTPHPNDDYESGMTQLIEQRRESVRKAWETKWERQKQELKWPEDLPSDFVRIVEQMRPIEKVDVSRRPIPASLRRTYQAFVKKMLPQLAARIDAKWEPAERGRMGRFGEGSSSSRSSDDGEAIQPVEQTYLVEWDPTNQGYYKNRFDWGSEAPGTMDVLYAQEDLWVLQTVIDIIRRTNGDAMIRSQAPIKTIHFIQIGSEVTPPDRQGFKVVRPAPIAMEDGSGDEVDEVLPAGDPGVDFGTEPPIEGTGDFMPAAPQTEEDKAMELVKNRYYDENYQPIADMETLLSSVTVAKRIPVKLRVTMDQRFINELLVECANAPLTYEVRQLRFNPADTGQMGYGGERGSMEGGGSFGGNNQAKTLEDYESLDRVIELFGIIYIFNPVDEGVLGGEGPSGLDDLDDTAQISIPAHRSKTGQQLLALLIPTRNHRFARRP